MIGDTSIYPKMGQLIFNVAPDRAVKLIMRATLEISDEGDVGGFEFDYLVQGGHIKWFDAGASVTTELTKLLIDLRQSYVDNGQDAWNKCEFIVDVEKGKFQFNIDYEDEEEL